MSDLQMWVLTLVGGGYAGWLVVLWRRSWLVNRRRRQLLDALNGRR